MHLAGQSASDRIWRPLHQPRRSLRQSVRVAAFHEQSRKPHAKDSSSLPTPAHPATVTTPTAIPSSTPSTPPPLNPTPKYPDADTFAALPPAALAAALLSLTSPNHGADEPRSTTGTVANAADVVTYGTAAAIGERAVSDARLFHAAAAAIARHVYDMDAASLVDVLTAFSRAAAVDVRLGHAPSEGVEGRDVEKTATLEGGAVKGQVAEAVGADMVALCCGALSSKVDTLTPPDLTRLAQAVAAMRLSDPQLMAALCSRASDPSVLSSFPAPHLVALLEALARLSHRHPLLFTAAAEQLAATALPSSGGGDVLTPVQAVSAVWAMAAVGQYHRPLFDGVGALLLDRLGALGGSDLARLAWAYGTIRHADESHRTLWDRDLYDGIAGVCLEHGVSSFPPRALVTLIWSYAAIPHFDGPLLSALSAAAAPLLPTLPPHDLVALAWAVTRLGHSHTGLMAALGEAALGAVGELEGEELTAIAMAFPATKAYSEKFFKYLVSAAQTRPRFFGQVALLDIIRLISRVQHRDPEYYGPALQVLLDHVHEAFLDAPLGEEGDVGAGGCMNRFRFG